MDMIACSLILVGVSTGQRLMAKANLIREPENNYLKGIDHIFKAKDGFPIRYALRFHINPDLSVVKTMSGNSALIQITKNKSVIFTIKDENLEIEKGMTP